MAYTEKKEKENRKEEKNPIQTQIKPTKEF